MSENSKPDNENQPKPEQRQASYEIDQDQASDDQEGFTNIGNAIAEHQVNLGHYQNLERKDHLPYENRSPDKVQSDKDRSSFRKSLQSASIQKLINPNMRAPVEESKDSDVKENAKSNNKDSDSDPQINLNDFELDYKEFRADTAFKQVSNVRKPDLESVYNGPICTITSLIDANFEPKKVIVSEK